MPIGEKNGASRVQPNRKDKMGMHSYVSQSLHRRIKESADKNGETINDWLRLAAEQRLRREEGTL